MFKKRIAKVAPVNLNTEISQIQCIPEIIQQSIRRQQIQQNEELEHMIKSKINPQITLNSFNPVTTSNKMHFSSKSLNQFKNKQFEQNDQNDSTTLKTLNNENTAQRSNKLRQRQTFLNNHSKLNFEMQFQVSNDQHISQPLNQIKNQTTQTQEDIQNKEMLDFLQILKQNKKFLQEEQKNYKQFQKPFEIQQNILIIDDKQSDDQKLFENTLQVVQDYEPGISPVMSEEEGNFYNHEQDYEDVLIRKTLTRQNYKKISQTNGLKNSKQKSKSEKLIKMITAVSENQLQNNINHQIIKKSQVMSQLKRELEYLQQRTNEKEKQISQKRQTTNQLKQEYKKLMKIIYFICYKGQTIEEFDMKSLIEISQDLDIEEYGKNRNGTKKVKLNQNDQNDGEAYDDQEEQEDGLQVVMEEDQY